MRKKINIIISCIVTLFLTVSLLGYLTDLMERKSSDSKYADFFAQDEDFNVLFMGTSHVTNAIYPMELWDDYGIISYNFGGHSNKMATTYWVMENALDYTQTELVVIDCLSISSSWKCSDKFSFLHLSLDAFPTSITKVEAIWDLLDDQYLDEAIENGKTRESDEPRTKIGLLWDYSVFHNRWDEIERNDFEPSINLEKGAESRINVAKGQLRKISSSQKMESGTISEEYLRRMIGECQSRGIDVLLTYLPFPASEQQQKEANYIYDLADEYGVNYINFLDMDLIDYQTDLYDESSHLNPSGARKVTDYLGEYIVSHYSIRNQKDNSDYDFWEQDYEEYIELKNNNLRGQTNIVNYLMLLSGEKADIILDVRNKDLFKNEWIKVLLANIGVKVNDLTEETDFIIKMNDCDEAIVVNNLRENGKSLTTSIGTIQLLYANQEGTGDYKLYINGLDFLTGREDDTGLSVVVRRGDTMVDHVRFVYTVDSDTTNVNVTAANRE